jgi:hypothetical protein
MPVAADNLRLGFWNVELNRQGPGLLLRDLSKGEDPQIAAVLAVLEILDADILVLTGVDFDLGLMSLSALADQLGKNGNPYPYRFALPPNTGVATGLDLDLDLDGDGKTGGPRDAQGYGRFPGEGGMAILSRLPVDTAAARSFSSFLWQDLPGAMLPSDMTKNVADVQRLSSNAHWDVPVRLPGGQNLHLLTWHATPSVFDGPEDRNGRRNHDEAAFWLRLIDGELPIAAPQAPFVLIGQPNLDPERGEGLPDALRSLLKHPALQDPEPKGAMGLATADFTARNGPGNLRSDMILPSGDLRVIAAGVTWPEPGDPDLATLIAASRHRPVWVDLALP